MTLQGMEHVSPIVISACLMVAAMPLIGRKVPLNSFYGFRTPKTLSDTRIWYDANAKAGVNLLVAGVVTLAVWGTCWFVGGPPMASKVAIPTAVITQGVGLVLSFVQLSRM